MLPRMPLFDLDDDAPTDGWSKWGLGIAVPVIVSSHGISRMISRHVTLYGRRGFHMPLTGLDAVVYGIVLLAVALFLHARYFMPNSKRMSEYADLGKIVALLVGLAGFGFLVVRNFTLI